MHPKIRRSLVLLIAAPAAIFAYVTVSLVIVHHVRGVKFSYEHNGTDLTFASSDGLWRGEENMLSGRDFMAVLLDFELYRIRSNQPGIRLLRTKPWKKPWQWAWWFDRRHSAKWQVPYTPPAEMPPAPRAAATKEDYAPAELARAHREAEAYLQTLR